MECAPVYEWLLDSASERKVDAIILAGDLLGCPDGFDTAEEAQTHEAATLVELLDSASMPVFYIMGNDDLVELNSSSARVQSIHARRIEFGDVNVVGYQYPLPFMGGTFEKCILRASSRRRERWKATGEPRKRRLG